MAQQTNRVQEGVDQIRTQIRKIQRQVTTRRKALEKELATRRKAFEKELARVQKDLARQPLVKQAQKQAGSLRAGAQSRIEAGVATFLGALPLATRGEIDRIDRKLRAIDRRLREMDKSHGAKSHGHAA